MTWQCCGCSEELVLALAYRLSARSEWFEWPWGEITFRHLTGRRPRLHIVPNLGIFRAARHILPEVNAFLVIVDVIEMQTLHFVGCHELCRLWIRRNIVGFIGDELLRFGLDHVFKKFVRQLFVLAG